VTPIAEHRSDQAAPPAGAGEADLQLQITHAWLRLLPEPADRNRFAVRPYRVHHELVEQLAAIPQATGPVADAAVRILTGHAWTQITPVPVRVEHQGVPVLRRHDRAVGWRYPLDGADQWLYWWQPAVGALMLARFAGPGSTTLPGVDTTPPVCAPGPSRVPVPTRRGPTAASALVVVDEQLVDVLRRADGPLYVSELRRALEIPEDVPRERVSSQLNAAIDRGVIVKTGQRRGTRYALPE
jgi:hypothetical protein